MENIGFGKRLVAAIIDLFIFAIVVNVLQIFIFRNGFLSPRELDAMKLLFSTLGGLAYYIIMWARFDGATIGKKILKIKIVNDDGSALTDQAVILRFLGYILSAIPLLLGFFWILWDREKKGWHDKIAKTRVISA
jgi:uncharacterized RDD family membrane protein YckC